MGTSLVIFDCHRYASLSVRPFDTIQHGRMDNPFLGIASAFLMFFFFFQILLISFKDIKCFPVLEAKLWLF